MNSAIKFQIPKTRFQTAAAGGKFEGATRRPNSKF
jgi:hypothetical protein